MHIMQASRALQGSATCLVSISVPPLRSSKPARRCSIPQAAKQQQQPQQQQQQQQQQQPPPVNNFKDLMQKYKSMVPAAAKPQQKASPSSKPSAGSTSSSSTDSKGAPRLKPTQKPSAAPNSPSKRRAAAAAKPAASKAKPGGFGAPAERTGSKGATTRGRDSNSSSSSKSAQSSSRSRSAQGSFDDASEIGRRSSSESRSSSSSSQRSVIPGGWLMPSNGKGFGTQPAAAAPAVSKTPGGQNIVRIFRFGVEAAVVSKAVEACGWQALVALVDSIKEADLILAAKCSSGGKHRNLAQGEKAASNAGIPFVVVGRKLSADNFRQALIPHLEPNSQEAAALASAAKEAAAKAAANKAEADAFFRSAVAWKAPRQ